MERFPRDRDLKPWLVDYHYGEMKDGHFRGSEWVSCLVEETNQVYRMNGKHTSTAMIKAFEDGVKLECWQTIRQYACKTLRDAAHLFQTFDPGKSARKKGDVIRVFASSTKTLGELPPRILSVLTSGIAYGTWEGTYRRHSVDEQSTLLADNETFAREFADFIEEGKGEDKKYPTHVLRMPVCAAMFRVYQKHGASAAYVEFWSKIRDDSNDDKDAPTRLLYKWLQVHKQGRGAGKATRVSEREVFVRCLQSWNATVGDGSPMRYADNTKTPEVA